MDVNPWIDYRSHDIIKNDQGEKIRALFDAREAQNDVNERIFRTMNRIENKLNCSSFSGGYSLPIPWRKGE